MAWTGSILVVANVTAGSDELLGAMRARAQAAPVAFTLLVPAPAGQRGTAAGRLGAALERMRAEGLEVTGLLGDGDPLVAVQEAWDPRAYDEVIVSTLPGQTSRWLMIDLPHRVAGITGVQVTHVVALPERPAREPVPAHLPEKPALGPLSVLAWGRH
jgi:hypothetical protein